MFKTKINSKCLGLVVTEIAFGGVFWCFDVWGQNWTGTFRKLHQNPDFILVYTNTIYILNNIILECFDIAFKETIKEKKKQFLSSQWQQNCNLNSRKMKVTTNQSEFHDHCLRVDGGYESGLC